MLQNGALYSELWAAFALDTVNLHNRYRLQQSFRHYYIIRKTPAFPPFVIAISLTKVRVALVSMRLHPRNYTLLYM